MRLFASYMLRKSMPSPIFVIRPGDVGKLLAWGRIISLLRLRIDLGPAGRQFPALCPGLAGKAFPGKKQERNCRMACFVGSITWNPAELLVFLC